MEYSEYITTAFWQERKPIYLEGSGLKNPLGQVKGVPEGAVLFSSSGSGGGLKWIVHTRESLLFSARMVNEFLEVSDQDRLGLLLPLYHVGGFGILVRAYARWGAEPDLLAQRLFVQHSPWSPEAAVEYLEANRITITSLVPTQIYDLVSLGLVAPKALRVIVVGGGQLSQELGSQARALGWPVLQSYGMSEAGSQIATASLESLAEPYSCEDLVLLKGWKASCDLEGRLAIKGGAICHGIITQKGSEMTYTPTTIPYQTQDKVELIKGRLTFRRRVDRVIKIKGELVDLDSLESKLSDALQSPVVVLPESNARDGMRLTIVTKRRDQEKVLTHLLPKFIEIQKIVVVSEIPKSGLGKIDRRALRELLR